MDYKKAGVDIEAGYKSVELMKEHVRSTMRAEVLGGLGGFSGAFSLEKIKEMEEPVLLSGTDGCGTKVKLAMILDKHDTIGIDAVAMCVNDIACAGGEPLFFLDYIACGKNYPEKIASIVSGVAEGCRQSGAALIGGETAEHPGLMPTEEGPKVLEYNARFGDPEAQVVLPRMKNDLIDVIEACIDGNLAQVDLQFEDNAAVCVVLASDGYPVSYEKGYPIKGLDRFDSEEGYYCFHAGTKFDEKGQIVTNGGRVLGVTATGKDLKEARANAYKATEWVEFDNKYMRHDIGKAIDEAL